MPFECGRYLGTSRDERICELCSLDKLGDEFHYMSECTYFEDFRTVYLPSDLVNPSDNQLTFKIAKYCKVMLNTFQKMFRNI